MMMMMNGLNWVNSVIEQKNQWLAHSIWMGEYKLYSCSHIMRVFKNSYFFFETKIQLFSRDNDIYRVRTWSHGAKAGMFDGTDLAEHFGYSSVDAKKKKQNKSNRCGKSSHSTIEVWHYRLCYVWRVKVSVIRWEWCFVCAFIMSKFDIDVFQREHLSISNELWWLPPSSQRFLIRCVSIEATVYIRFIIRAQNALHICGNQVRMYRFSTPPMIKTNYWNNLSVQHSMFSLLFEQKRDLRAHTHVPDVS